MQNQVDVLRIQAHAHSPEIFSSKSSIFKLEHAHMQSC